MELRGGVEIPIALWGGLELRMDTIARIRTFCRLRLINRFNNNSTIHSRTCECTLRRPC